MLQRVTACCSVLQCVAVCCSVLQYVAACCSVLQRVAACCTKRSKQLGANHLQITLNLDELVMDRAWCSVMWFDTMFFVVCCSVLQCVAVCCSVLQ